MFTAAAADDEYVHWNSPELFRLCQIVGYRFAPPNLRNHYKRISRGAIGAVDARRPTFHQAELPSGNEHWGKVGQRGRCGSERVLTA
ncbi:hypothetical protein PCLA_06f0389 [Pseudomonas citronellolis]|nr:hypothetical protein PCLA_06f0389 [Pseudomonas citronellolis]